MRKDRLNCLKRDCSGAALVEFSLLLPIIFFSAFGMMEFGRALYQFHIANKGVKSAARFMARVPNPGLACPPTGPNWTIAETDSEETWPCGAACPALIPYCCRIGQMRVPSR